MTPREAIRQNLDGALDGDALMRALLSWPTWTVPARLGPQGPGPLWMATAGGPWLAAFSESSTWDAWRAASGAEPFFLTLDGPDLARILPDDLAGLDLEIGTSEAIHYKRHQLAALRRMGEAITAGRILRGEASPPDAWQRLRDHTWLVPVQIKDDGGATWMLAPDTQGRKLAAVFTADDTAAAFRAAVTRELGFTPTLREVPGEVAFRTLLDMPIDGIVFDCLGPIPPKAVAKAFAGVVLTQAQGA